MVEYRPGEVTEEAMAIADKYRAERVREGGDDFGKIVERIPEAESFNPSKGKRDVKIAARGLKTIQFGRLDVDLSAVEQLVELSQTRAIADAIHYATKFMDGESTLAHVALDPPDLILLDIMTPGMDGYAVCRSLKADKKTHNIPVIFVTAMTDVQDPGHVRWWQGDHEWIATAVARWCEEPRLFPAGVPLGLEAGGIVLLVHVVPGAEPGRCAREGPGGPGSPGWDRLATGSHRVNRPRAARRNWRGELQPGPGCAPVPCGSPHPPHSGGPSCSRQHLARESRFPASPPPPPRLVPSPPRR